MIIILLYVLAFIIYDIVPSKYNALETGYDEKLKEFEYEKSPLHTIVYGGSGKTNLVKQYLQLHTEEERPIIFVCEDKSDWEGYNTTAGIGEIMENNIGGFKEAALVLDDMGGKLNKQITYYFTIGRHHDIQMIVMCHKSAQTDNI